jgi:tetratricopeptide (TPR) repeat protein
VASGPSSSLPPQDDYDLTSPEELQARQRKRRLLWILALAAALLVAAGFAASPVRNYIRGWQSRRAARASFALIERQQWGEASARARDALQLQFTEPQAWRAVARVLSRTHQDASALEWWKKLEEAGLLTLEDRREYTASALTAGELATAATQIDPLLAQREGPAPVDILLAGQLAVRKGDGVLAVDYAGRVLADKRAKPNEILSGAILVLSVTKPESPAYINAWKRIEDVARDPGNVVSLAALVFLAQQPKPTPAATSAGGVRPVATMSALEIADRLENHPKAGPYHHLIALNLRARQNPMRADEFLDQAIQHYRGGDDDSLLALSSWLYTQGRYQAMLDVLPLERALQRRELFLKYLDALSALGRFETVRDLLKSERFPLEPVFQHMYLATAYERLGEPTAVANEWQRALEAADNAAKCLALGTYADKAGAAEIADSAYAKAISFAPSTREAYAGRVRLAEAHGQTAKAEQILAEIVRLWPDDDHERNHEMYLRLLLGASGADAEKAVREGEVLVAREPFNWHARATVALAQLRLGHHAEALQAFKGIKAEEGSPVGPLAVRAAALDANGWKEGAKGDARTLAAAPLLPEERALIAPLLSDQGQ